MSKKYHINFHLIDLDENEYNEIIMLIMKHKTKINTITGGEDKSQEKIKNLLNNLGIGDVDSIYNQIVQIYNE